MKTAVMTLMLMVLAQAGAVSSSSPSLDLMTQLVSALGPMGFVMWLVYRTTNHTIPRLAKSFEDAGDRQRSDFKEALNDQRDAFSREMERERQVHTEQMGRLASAVERLDRRRGDTDVDGGT